MQRLIAATLIVALGLVGSPMLVGCDRTVSHEKTVRDNGDETVTKEKKVTENPDTGTVTKTERKTVQDH